MLMFGFLLSGYLFFRVILPLRFRWWWKAVLTVVLLAVAFKFHLLHLIGGPIFFAPELPGPLLLAAAWLFAVLFLLFFLLVAADLVRVCLFLTRLRLRRPMRFNAACNRVNAGLLILAFLLATVGVVSGTAVPAVREVSIEIENLPEEADGLTIAVLADLHVDSLTRANRIRRMVERVNARQPDLVVLVGDLADGTVAKRGGELVPLRELSARYGIFGVPGNHEYYSGYQPWRAFLATLGVEMLENESRLLPVGIALAGITDVAASRMGDDGPDFDGALAEIPGNMVVILLSHRPQTAPEAAERGIALQISGHTHGGMILGVDRFVAGFNGGFVSGLYKLGATQLYVTNGAAIWNGFPVRIGVPSEIALIRLVRKSD